MRMVAAEDQAGAVCGVHRTGQRCQDAGRHRRRRQPVIQELDQATTSGPLRDHDRDGRAEPSVGLQHIEHPCRTRRLQTSRTQCARHRSADHPDRAGIRRRRDEQGQRDVTIQHQVAAPPQPDATAVVPADLGQQAVTTLADKCARGRPRGAGPVGPRPRRVTAHRSDQPPRILSLHRVLWHCFAPDATPQHTTRDATREVQER